MSKFFDLCGRRPLRDQNLEVCRFADGYRLTGTQIIVIDSKPNIKVRTGMVADRTARKILPPQALRGRANVDRGGFGTRFW